MQLVINIFYHSPHVDLEAVFRYRHTTQYSFVGPVAVLNAIRVENRRCHVQRYKKVLRMSLLVVKL